MAQPNEMNKPPKTFDKQFITGGMLMVIGALLVLTFYFALVGAAIILLGLWFVWRSKKRDAIKMVFTVAPIVLFAAVLWLPPGGVNPAKDTDVELYCIPENYRGRVLVIFDEACGQRRKAPKYVEYHIPFYGSCVFRHKLRQHADRRFQFINPNNGYWLKEAKLLPNQQSVSDVLPDGVYVSQLSTGSGVANGDHYEYLTFVVDSLRGAKADRASLECMIDVTLTACRDNAAKKRKANRTR